VLEWGKRYEHIVSCLQEASRRSRCPVRGFHEMSVEEVSFTSNLPLEQAALAKLREYDEPFLILDLRNVGRLLHAIEKLGLRWTKGRRFFHITDESESKSRDHAAAALRTRSRVGGNDRPGRCGKRCFFPQSRNCPRAGSWTHQTESCRPRNSHRTTRSGRLESDTAQDDFSMNRSSPSPFRSPKQHYKWFHTDRPFVSSD